jgi:hypothetical protein
MMMMMMMMISELKIGACVGVALEPLCHSEAGVG